MATEQSIADTYHTNALASIAECLAATDKQHIVVRVAGHRWLVGSLERCAQVLAEIHGKIGQVFHHDGVVFGGQFADSLQFVFIETNPRRVVGVAIYHGADIAL